MHDSTTMVKSTQSVHRVWAEYAERLARLGRAKSTQRSFQRAVHYLARWMEDNEYSFEELEPELLEEFFSVLPLAPSTKRLYLVEIRAAVRYAHRRGLIQRDPTLDVQLARVPDTVPRVLNGEQLRSLFRACATEPERTMLALAVFTGMRRFEIAGLTWDNIDLRQGTISIVGKQGKYRIIPIHPALGEVLADVPFKMGRVLVGPQGGTGVSMLVYMLDAVAQRADVAVKFHDFRRTFASSLDANGVQQGVIERILGWAANGIFDKHYRNVADKRLQEAILLVYADSPVQP